MDRLPGTLLDMGPGNAPAWSPDGKQIVFRLNVTAYGQRSGILVMNADGTNRRRIGTGDHASVVSGGTVDPVLKFRAPSAPSVRDRHGHPRNERS